MSIPTLELFELSVYRRNYEDAAKHLSALLKDLDGNYGQFGAGFQAISPRTITSVHYDEHVLARVCAAVGSLFADPSFFINEEWQNQFITWHRWMSTLFAASSFRNADHLLRAINQAKNPEHFEFATNELHKFCMLYLPDSEIPINLDGLWAVNKKLAVSLCMALLSPRFLGTEAAHAKREVILEWLPAKLMEYENLFDLPFGILHDVYMHCSYADRADKHEIKRTINQLIRKQLLSRGYADRAEKNVFASQRPSAEKPVIVILLEWFSSSHSVFRTHSETLRGLKKNFRTIALGMPGRVDDAGKDVFSEYYDVPSEGTSIFDQLNFVASMVDKYKPEIFFCPAVGMFLLTIFAANLRFAPIQMAALGHGASTMSPCMDYFVLEKDFLGDPACFSEEVLQMPIDGMPFVPSSARQDLTPVLREAPVVVRVAVAATPMKYNPQFLMACQKIKNKSKVPVEFHFLAGMSQGFIYMQLNNLIQRCLPGAVVHRHLNYPEYMQVVNQCDLFINPFPYGNMNGIADMADQGLVGVCKTGPDVHEHIDEGLFRRLNFPAWLIADTVQDYVDASVRLIEDHALRLELRRALIESRKTDVLYSGRPQVLGELLRKKLS